MQTIGSTLRVTLLIFFLTALCGCIPFSPALEAELTPSYTPKRNPDRGFFSQVKIVDSLSIPPERLRGGLLRVYFHIPSAKSHPLPSTLLYQLSNSLDLARQTHTSLVLRFIYDYPEAELEIYYREASDPDIATIRTHVNQIGELISRTPDSVTAIEAGMFGFWGEQHGARADLQALSFSKELAQAWLTATADTEIPILFRYSRTWNFIRDQLNSRADVIRIGRWNDCIAAIDDTDFIAPTNNLRALLPIFKGGEVCQLQPKSTYDCTELVPYLKNAGFSYLNGEYFPKTIQTWKDSNCYSTIEEHLGYVYSIEFARLHKTQLEIGIRNIGWGIDPKIREIGVSLNGRIVLATAQLRQIRPNELARLFVSLPRSPKRSDSMQIYIHGDVDVAGLVDNLLVFRDLQ